MTTEGLTFIIFCMSLFALLFGNRYLSNKERMYMIEKGMITEPVKPVKREQFLTTLKIAVLLIGVGFGVLLGFVLINYTLIDLSDPEVIYVATTGLFAGIGLLIAFFFEKNYYKKGEGKS